MHAMHDLLQYAVRLRSTAKVRGGYTALHSLMWRRVFVFSQQPQRSP